MSSTVTSTVEIANLALGHLGVARITSLSENTRQARAIADSYNTIRDAALRSHPWNFAVKRAKIAELSTPPAHGFGHAYGLPPDFLRLLAPDDACIEKIYLRDHRVENGTVVSNDSGPLPIRYIARIEDVTQYSSDFVQAFALMLAKHNARLLTGSGTLKAELAGEATEARSEARRVNALERPPQEPILSPWASARFRRGGRNGGGWNGG